MANKRISDLGTATTMTVNDLLVVVNESQTKKATVSSFLSLIAANEHFAELDEDGKLLLSQIPDSILGAVNYKGAWNGATPMEPASVDNKGWYYVLSANSSAAVNGVSDWKTGDWIISNGNVWQKIDNSDAMTSFNGRNGAVVPQAGDYTADMIQETDSRKFYTAARVLSQVLTGITNNPQGLTEEDTILSAFDKLQGEMDQRERTSGKNAPFGYPGLDGSGKIDPGQLPSSVLGGANYQGSWNAATNSPALPAPAIGNKGWYYVVNTDGSTSINGITDWKVGDWVISSGTAWEKIDNTDAIASWNGRTGAIAPITGDYTTDMVPESDNNKYYTAARVLGELLTGLSLSTNPIEDGNSIAEAFGKTQGQLNTKENKNSKGQPNGYAGLDPAGKVPVDQLPDTLFGAVSYKGSWNAAINSPAIPAAADSKGWYYVVGTAGSTSVSGITDWNVGDWIISNGAAWQKIDNTDAVVSWKGRTGAIQPQTNDYNTDQVNEGSTNKYYTGPRVLNEQLTALSLSNSNDVVVGDSIQGAMGKIQAQLNALEGAVIYQGTWNAATNSPTIGAAGSTNKGKYYVVATAGITTIDGISEWAVGDWIISNGSSWQKVDNSVLAEPLATPLNLSNSAIVSGDTIQAAFGKTQAQLNKKADLDNVTGKIPVGQLPDSVLGAVSYQGSWNANTNSPAISAAAPANKGWYYVVGTAGATSIGGITDWKVGDWVISSGTAWQKVDNTDAVISFNGRIGAIVGQAGDYTADIVNEGPMLYNRYYTGDRVRNESLTGLTPLPTAFSITASDTVLTAFGRLQAQLNTLTSALLYQGTWNAATNSPAIPAAGTTNKGWLYVVGTAGATPVNSITEWKVGDWVISNGSAWQKVDNTNALAEPLTGFSVPTAAAITATDTVLGAFGKLQAQLNSAIFYQGTWNANTNSPAIPTAGSTNKGWLYVVGTAGITAVGGITDWAIGDWVISNGTTWQKVENSNTLAEPLTGLSTLTTTPITSSDNVLGAFGKLQAQLTALSGAVIYQGTWNASTNSPAMASATVSKGKYFVVATAGTTTIDGINEWGVGDWIISNGVAWQKIDNSVLTTPLAGFSTSTSAITSADTILSAFGKAQGQLNAKESTANKGNANGYPELDANAQIPREQLPAGSKIVRTFFSGLPAIDSGSGTNQLAFVYQFPNHPFMPGDQLDLTVWFSASNSGGTKQISVYFNTTGAIGTGLVATYKATTNALSEKFSREFTFTGSTSLKSGVNAINSSKDGTYPTAADPGISGIPNISGSFYIVIGVQKPAGESFSIDRVILNM